MHSVSSSNQRALARERLRHAHDGGEQLVIFDAGGALWLQSGNDMGFASTGALVLDVAARLGDELALGLVVALECQSYARSVFVYRDVSGGLVAVARRGGLECVTLRSELAL